MVPARRWLVVALGCAVVAIAVYFLAVWTVPGQELENAALRGADEAAARDQAAADESLGRITVYSLAAAVVLVTLVGLVRRRLDLALAAAGVIVAGQVVTQVLKRFVLPRPSLVPLTGHYAENSLPSGHTTIAMTVLFAALIVVPYRWRGVALFFLLSWAVGIGAYTVTAKWHRLSDTLAADAIALGTRLRGFVVARAPRGRAPPRGQAPDPAGGRRDLRRAGRAGVPGPRRNPDRRDADPRGATRRRCGTTPTSSTWPRVRSPRSVRWPRRWCSWRRGAGWRSGEPGA